MKDWVKEYYKAILGRGISPNDLIVRVAEDPNYPIPFARLTHYDMLAKYYTFFTHKYLRYMPLQHFIEEICDGKQFKANPYVDEGQIKAVLALGFM